MRAPWKSSRARSPRPPGRNPAIRPLCCRRACRMRAGRPCRDACQATCRRAAGYQPQPCRPAMWILPASPSSARVRRLRKSFSTRRRELIGRAHQQPDRQRGRTVPLADHRARLPATTCGRSSRSRASPTVTGRSPALRGPPVHGPAAYVLGSAAQRTSCRWSRTPCWLERTPDAERLLRFQHQAPGTLSQRSPTWGQDVARARRSVALRRTARSTRSTIRGGEGRGAQRRRGRSGVRPGGWSRWCTR